MTLPFFYRSRDALAALPSLLVLVALVFTGIQTAVKIQPHNDDSLVQITLTEPPPALVLPPTPLTPLTPPPVLRPPAPPRTPTPPVLQPVVPASVPSTLPAATVLAAAPVSRTSAVVAATPAPAPVAVAPPPPPKPDFANIEGEYIGKLRAHLNSIKRYPTGREASQQRPQGKVKVWFILRRDGTLVDAGIESSSNSMLLDDAARKTINRATFSGFPDASWSGQTSHRFSAELEFFPAS